jgi:GNAT superfamily N-acetyltransferase
VATPGVEAEPRQERVGRANFTACYALLSETFSVDELDSPEDMLADLEAPEDGEPVRFLMLARSLPSSSGSYEPHYVISLIAGCYLSLEKTGYHSQGIGFIEYLVTRPGYRNQGHASALLAGFEAAVQEIASKRGEQLDLILGEVGQDLVSFKRKRGYQLLPGSRYAQPPIAFDPHSGAPLSDPLPMLLMLKTWVQPLPVELLLSAVGYVFAQRYGLRRQSGPAADNAAAFISQQVFTIFASSLRTVEGMVILG